MQQAQKGGLIVMMDEEAQCCRDLFRSLLSRRLNTLATSSSSGPLISPVVLGRT